MDTATSIQIMELIKEVAKDRLVVMVTHNPDLAEKYADRIIRFQDGKIISDNHPHQERPKPDGFSLKKTSMSFWTALKLSFNNIRTKKGRTFLTSFASSIGIIGIAVILSLSTGFQTQIDEFQSNAMAEFPIVISKSAMEVDMESMKTMQENMKDQIMGTTEYADSDEVYLYDPSESTLMHTNVFTDDFIAYLNQVDPEICSGIGYTYIVSMNMLRDIDGEITPVSLQTSGSSQSSMMGNMSNGMSSMGLSSYPKQLGSEENDYLPKNYDLLAGDYPKSATDLVLVIDSKNRIDYNILKNLGFDTEEKESIDFSAIVGTELKIIANNDYYVKTQMGSFLPNTDYQTMYQAENNITVKISGIVRQKQDVKIGILGNGIAYSDELAQMVIETAKDSDIVKAQKESDKNVIQMNSMTEEEKEQFVSYLGGDTTPYMIMLYPKDFETKDSILSYLDSYNEGRENDDQIVYTDLAGTMSDMTSGIMDGITIVLIAFAGISLVVSLIMICIITYTSVLERTKEIGILRALGARKKDITRVFDAETCILGVFSGVLGVVISWLLTFPINAILYRMTELSGVAHLQLIHAVILVAISTVLTVLGGHIPAKMASRKDAVEALRSE